MKTKTALEITHDSLENEGKVEKKSGKRIGYYYIIIRSLKQSKKNDVVKCLYIKGLFNFGFCVIKEGSYGDIQDKHGRDIKDRLVWQKQLHEALQDKLSIPRLLGHFEEKGNYYLVMQHIKGKPLHRACHENKRKLRDALIKGSRLGITFLNYLEQIIELLDTLHQQRIVHRDATANNFLIKPDGNVIIIDLELSYSLQQQFPLPAFQLGTLGYMSPQQEATETPTIEEDIFSIGAIILQLWSGISPLKITTEPFNLVSDKVRFFIPDQALADIVIRCFHPEPEKRPSTKDIRQAIYQYKMDLQKQTPRATYKPTIYTKENITATIQETIDAFSTPLFADPEKGWFSDNIQSQQDIDKNKIEKMWYASFNRGVSGIIYMLSLAKRTGFNVESSLIYVQKGLELIRERYLDRITIASSGLHFGSDGIAASLAIAIQNRLLDFDAEVPKWIEILLEKEGESWGFMFGLSGQGISNIISSTLINQGKMQQRLHLYINKILAGQERDGSWIYGSNETKKGRITRGFGDGMAGTVYFLLEYAEHFKHTECVQAAKKALHFLMKKAILKSGIVQWRSSINKELSPWWADGIAGIAHTFIKAYQLLQDQSYKRYAVMALNSLPPYITDSNLSQSNGLSGLGEVYLEAYNVFKEEQWKERAFWIVQVIMQLKKHHKQYGSYWLIEHERQPVANFMVGNSGILHFLMRYCSPEKLKFPMASGYSANDLNNTEKMPAYKIPGITGISV